MLRFKDRLSSRSREPVRQDRQQFNQDTWGRQRSREQTVHRSRSRRSREPGEVRSPSKFSFSQALSSAAQFCASPCKSLSRSRSKSPDSGAMSQHICSVQPLQPDPLVSLQVQNSVLDLLEMHLDPMLHEVKLHESMYSPDTLEPRAASPEFVPSGQQQVGGGETEFLASVTTPLPQPLLAAPAPAPRRPCKNKVNLPSVQRHSARLARKCSLGSRLEIFAQEILSKRFGFLDNNAAFDANVKKLYLQHFKKPLSPASLKTIRTLVDKGGCKAINLKSGKKTSAVVAPA